MTVQRNRGRWSYRTTAYYANAVKSLDWGRAPVAPPNAAPAAATSSRKSRTKSQPAAASSKVSDEVAKNRRNPTRRR